MRIVAGQWRGRRIDAPAGTIVRPTLDRVREAWMSILQMDIPGARVLDLFAGSGALGLECLSRGASAADFVDNDGRSLALLRKNIEALGADDKSTVHRADALRFAQGLAAGAFDICVADPPYSGGYAETLVAHWLKHPFASILSVEHDARNKLEGGADTRRYGSSAITFYRTGD
jgi:16S rRNA (guanine966-N2)-methyltransferase